MWLERPSLSWWKSVLSSAAGAQRICKQRCIKRKRLIVCWTQDTRASAHDMKDKIIVNEVKSAVSSTLNKKRVTIMSRLIEGMVSFCSIYEADFRYSAEGHELGGRGSMKEELDFVLSTSPTTYKGVKLMIMPTTIWLSSRRLRTWPWFWEM